MILRARLAQIKFLRFLVLVILRRISWDFWIRNPFSGDRLFLNLYAHKGYWFWRRKREQKTMAAFKVLVKPEFLVLEVGGHIGAITQYLAGLVGEEGRVIVFEPGPSNLRYLRKNVLPFRQVSVRSFAISDNNGFSILYQDQITGQNNSLHNQYSGLKSTASTHPTAAPVVETTIETMTLASLLKKEKITVVDFLKIDVEGHELAVLRSLGHRTNAVKNLMVEITENHHEVLSFLFEAGFEVYHDDLALQPPKLGPIPSGNYFAVRVLPRAFA